MVQKFLFNRLSLKCRFRLLQLCLNTLNHGVSPKQAKKKPDKAFEHCFFSILKVFLNLTHNFGKFLESKVITFYVNAIIVDSVESETSGTTGGKNRTTFFLPNWAKWEEWLLLFFYSVPHMSEIYWREVGQWTGLSKYSVKFWSDWSDRWK